VTVVVLKSKWSVKGTALVFTSYSQLELKPSGFDYHCVRKMSFQMCYFTARSRFGPWAAKSYAFRS
jgi:hypothetical protein